MEIDVRDELETKAGIPHEAVVTHGEMMRAFDAFKEVNDARLASIERYSADVLLEEKLARIDRAIDAHTRRLDEISLKRARPPLGYDGQRGNLPEHKAAFDVYIRSGDSANLRASNRKRFRVGQIPTVAFWCRRRSSTRSVSGFQLFRRSARLPASASSAAISTRSR